MPDTKIATCCYCGTRAALKLVGNVQHELACSRCGAPLHQLKMLPKARLARVDMPLMKRAPQQTPSPRPEWRGEKKRKPRKSECKRRKPRKSLSRRFFEEAFDVIEDIFD